VDAVTENPRIEELRRRVQKDEASIAFAQLAEEYRRAGRFQEAIDTCRSGLTHHPGYLSAHVTLGRALIETGELQSAQDELTRVLAAAPENLAALRGLAEIHHRRGELQQALDYYRSALELARHDPDLEHLVAQIGRELEPTRRQPVVKDGLSFEEAMGEFMALSDRDQSAGGATAAPAETPGAQTASEPPPQRPASNPAAPWTSSQPVEPVTGTEAAGGNGAGAFHSTEPAGDGPAGSGRVAGPNGSGESDPVSPERAALQVDALERWLDSILANREPRA
jgi:tetratricopeptide (TPR) repeat protein